MIIDDAVERRVHAAFDAAVRQDAAALTAALQPLDAPDSLRALTFGMRACCWVVWDVLEDDPTEENVDAMARDVVAGAGRALGLDHLAAVTDFLRMMTELVESGVDVPGGAFPRYVFGIGGFLLAEHSGDARTWPEYLDELRRRSDAVAGLR